MTFVYNAIQYAGPDLTPRNVRKGLFSVPATGGASDGTVSFQTGYGRTVGLPYDEYLALGTDAAMIWWNADLETQGTNAVENFPGTGRFMYLADGTRFSLGRFPVREPRFFDDARSVYEVPRARGFAGEPAPGRTPCTACPSAGAAAP
jgi:hypothetical protein